MKILSAKLGAHVWAGHQAAAEDQDLQEADRGGGGDRCAEPGQVPQGPAGARGNRGEVPHGWGTYQHHQQTFLNLTHDDILPQDFVK